MTSLVDELHALRRLVGDLELPLEVGGADDARRAQHELAEQIDDYLLPKLERLDAPLLAVLGGSTGAGKSTLTNSLIGDNVSIPGVLRPTTRMPVLVCHPDDEAWFLGEGVLPDLPRTTGESPGSGAGLQVVTSKNLRPGLALLDSPDIDSVEVANHDLAAQLLGAADLWLFVTTAARYADAVPWEYLARAQERSVALSVIVNRIPAGSEKEIGTHLGDMLRDKGLGDARLFAIAEGDLADGRLTSGLDPLNSWLDALVQDSGARAQLVRRSLDGALDSLPGRVEALASAVEVQASSGDALRAYADQQYDEALSRVDRELDSGNLLRGEVLDRWTEHVGTGEVMEKLQRGVGRLKDAIVSVFKGTDEQPNREVQGALESSLSVLVRDAADTAALEVVEGWETMPGGPEALVGASANLNRATTDIRKRIEGEIESWQAEVLQLVNDQAGSKLAVARTLSLGINSVGVALMVAVFSQTGGLTGGEAAVAGGTAAVSQAVLTAVFGDNAVSALARDARTRLLTRVQSVLDTERSRFGAQLGRIPDAESGEQLRLAASSVEAARL